MRVLFVHRQEGKTVGGAWNALLRMVTFVGNHGIVPELLFTRDVQDAGRLAGIRWDMLALPPARKGKSFPRYPISLWRLVQFLRERTPDVIHLNVLDDAIFFAMARKMSGGIPVIGHARSINPPAKFRKTWIHRLDRAVCVSEAVRRQVVQAGVPAERTFVVYDPPDRSWEEWPTEGVRAEWRQRLGLTEGAPVIGTVGNISRVKGPDVLIRALPEIVRRYPAVRCVFVGGDDRGMRTELASLADACGVLGNVVFAGALADPRPVVSLMDVFVLPSREEGYGIALLEAMAYGRAVVASRVGGVVDLVSGDEFGVLVPPEDAGALGEAVSELLGNSSRRTRMGEVCRVRAGKQFGEEQLLGLCRIYRDLGEGCAG